MNWRQAFAIAVALLAVALFAAWALSVWNRGRMSANEAEVLGALTRIRRAQEWFESDRGKYGSLEELEDTGVIEAEFGDTARENRGTAIYEGYRFRMFLPQASWVCYAWPVRFEETGIRAFAANPEGLLARSPSPWDGAQGPEAEASLDSWTKLRDE